MAGGWAGDAVGSTQHRSKARARIDGQAVRSFMTIPDPFECLSIRSGAWAAPSDTALVTWSWANRLTLGDDRIECPGKRDRVTLNSADPLSRTGVHRVAGGGPLPTGGR